MNEQWGWNVPERERSTGSCNSRLPPLPQAVRLPVPPSSAALCRTPAICSRWYPMYTWASWWAPSQLVKTAELDPGGRYLLGIHPHGVLGNSSLLALGSEALGWSRLFPGIRLSQGEVQGAGRWSQC